MRCACLIVGIQMVDNILNLVVQKLEMCTIKQNVYFNKTNKEP
jgi:hypothetical protein